MTDEDVPFGAIAYREYEVSCGATGIAKMAITLGSAESNTEAAKIARDAGAHAFGLAFMVDHPDAPALPAIWMRTATDLLIMGVGEGLTLGLEIRQLIEAGLEAFFEDIQSLAPGLDVPAVRLRVN